MKHFKLSSGDAIPAIGYGTWKLNSNIAYQSVVDAVSVGYRHIDCAYIYQNEDDIGRALSDLLHSKTVDRSKLWITSKLWNSFHRPELVEQNCRISLKALRLEYFDLYLMHWPISFRPKILYPEKLGDVLPNNPDVLLETWYSMQQLVKKKLVRNIGVSNFSVSHLTTIINNSDFLPAVNQIEAHPYLRQNSLYDLCKNYGIHVSCYSPLGSADRPRDLKNESEPTLLSDKNIYELSSKVNITPAQLLLAWHINQGRSVLVKSENKTRMMENIASTNIELGNMTIDDLHKISTQYRYVNPSSWKRLCEKPSELEFWD